MNVTKSMITNEKELMFKLCHKNIVRIINFLSTKNSYYFIFELCTHGDLYQFMRNHTGGKFKEEDARILMKELSGAFRCMQ